MLAGLLSIFIKCLTDSAVSAISDLISAEMQKRNLVQQGIQEQVLADQKATIQEATDANAIRTQVSSSPNSSVDAELERLRKSSANRRG